MKYQKLNDRILKELKSIVGEPYVIYNDAEKLEPYSHDEVKEKAYHAMPEAVVRPHTAQEIAALMKLANREKVPVTPRGGGSGLSGGAVPVHGGIVLHLDRMNKILEVDAENLVVVAEPGVVTNEIDEAVAEHGLFFAGYPMSLQSCHIGGNVAENAGGGKAVKYGVTGRYILGLELVTPEGEIVTYGGKVVKNVTGYDMVSLMVGSEGTLGIVTKMIIRLLPRPSCVVDLLVAYPDAKSAIGSVPKIISQARLVPTAIEFMDRLCIQASCKYLNEKIPVEGVGAMLLIELDGTEMRKLEDEYETIGDLCLSMGAKEVYVADNKTTMERIWNIRRNIAEAFMVQSPHQSLEDITVPISRIPDILPELEKLSQEYGISAPCYGHAGDGNLHVTFVKNPDTPLERWEEILPTLLKRLYAVTQSLGGVISGEHGIGSKRSAYMPYSLNPASIEFMKRVKTALDPNNVLNPGKIFG